MCCKSEHRQGISLFERNRYHHWTLLRLFLNIHRRKQLLDRMRFVTSMSYLSTIPCNFVLLLPVCYWSLHAGKVIIAAPLLDLEQRRLMCKTYSCRQANCVTSPPQPRSLYCYRWCSYWLAAACRCCAATIITKWWKHHKLPCKASKGSN